MSTVVFGGPSLHGVDRRPFEAVIEFQPPASRGDITRAVASGARRIGLIDGLFSNQPSVGHKEILHALASGVTVLGAASMGALRAAECDAFGMIGVGKIYRSYRFGSRTADADVAIVHAPAELDFLPLTVALVDAEATLAYMRKIKLMTVRDARALLRSARDLHFSERTWDAILQNSKVAECLREQLGNDLRSHRFSQKRRDAQELLALIARARIRRRRPALGMADLSNTGFLGA